MPGSAPAFDLVKARIIFETVDNATEPLRKIQDNLEEVQKKEKETSPKKGQEEAKKGWTEVALAIGSVVTATYGLARISPIFGSYVSMFFQALGAIMDQILLPLLPVFDWLIEKMWTFFDAIDYARKYISALYHEVLQFLGLEPKDSGAGTEGLSESAKKKGLYTLLGSGLGLVAARIAIKLLASKGIKLPGWGGTLLTGAGIILGGAEGFESAGNATGDQEGGGLGGIGGSLIGGIVGNMATKRLISSLATKMPLPPWLKVIAMLGGSMIGSGIGGSIGASATPQTSSDMPELSNMYKTRDAIFGFNANDVSSTLAGLGGMLGFGKQAQQPKQVMTVNFIITGNTDSVMAQVEQKLRETLRGIGTGSGLPS